MAADLVHWLCLFYSCKHGGKDGRDYCPKDDKKALNATQVRNQVKHIVDRAALNVRELAQAILNHNKNFWLKWSERPSILLAWTWWRQEISHLLFLVKIVPVVLAPKFVLLEWLLQDLGTLFILNIFAISYRESRLDRLFLVFEVNGIVLVEEE